MCLPAREAMLSCTTGMPTIECEMAKMVEFSGNASNSIARLGSVRSMITLPVVGTSITISLKRKKTRYERLSRSLHSANCYFAANKAFFGVELYLHDSKIYENFFPND